MVFVRTAGFAKRKSEVDESLQRYFGVADWAIDTEEANKLWENYRKNAFIILSNTLNLYPNIEPYSSGAYKMQMSIKFIMRNVQS